MHFYCIGSINFISIMVHVYINFEPISAIDKALIKTIDKDTFFGSSKAAKMVTKIMKVCHHDDLDKVVLAGEWNNFQIGHHYFPTSMPFKIYGISQKRAHNHQRTSGVYKLNENVVKKLYYPAKLFVISTPDHTFLRGILQHLKKSIIWNSRAFFIAIGKFQTHACSNVKLSIETLWKFNILNAIYICNGSEGNMNFYNFNPYTTHTVTPWKLIDQVIDEDRNHTTSIFHFSTSVRNFKAPLCGILNFDKTRTIQNYPIKMSGAVSRALFKNISVLKTINFLDDFNGIDAKIHKIIWTKLDGNPTIAIYDRGYIDSDHIPHGSIKEVINGKYDMGVNQYFSRNFWRLQTYPHSMSGIYAMSLEEKSNVDSRLMISDPVIFVVIVLVSLFMILGLKYYLEINITKALEINLKLLLGIPVRYVSSGGKKLFLVYVTAVAFTVSIFLQSSLSSSLVLPSNIFLINSRDDLVFAISLKYKVFGLHFITEFLDDDITKAFYTETLATCAEKLHTCSKCVCLSDGFTINEFAKDMNNIHISNHKIRIWDYVFIVQEDWPLKLRVNFLIGQLKESGILWHFTKNGLSEVQAHFDKHKGLKEHAYFRYLSLKSLDFCMCILFAGFLIAFCVFITERIRMRHYRRNETNPHKLDNLNIFKQNQS